MWILKTITEDIPERTFRILSGGIRTIGRSTGADFIVDVALVSRVHCRLVASDEALSVEDLSSTNGTFLNNQRIDHGTATGGDRLRIGRVELMVEKAVT